MLNIFKRLKKEKINNDQKNYKISGTDIFYDEPESRLLPPIKPKQSLDDKTKSLDERLLNSTLYKKENNNMNVSREFDTVKELAEHVLSNNPATRNSDTMLYAEMCKMLGAVTVDDISTIGLNVITVHKIRQVIQNKEGKYLPDENIKELRKSRSVSVRDYMRRLDTNIVDDDEGIGD